jgi:predicted DNA-binding mobile mystery protein A
MSGAQLARKMGVTPALISQAECNEVSGSVTLKTMQEMAEAMGCRFVCAILPPKGKETEDVILTQTMKKARAISERTDERMALEGQSLSSAELEKQIKRLAQRLAIEMKSDFWIEA